MIFIRSNTLRIPSLFTAACFLFGCAEVTRTHFPTGQNIENAGLPEGVRIVPLTSANIAQVSIHGRNAPAATQLPSARSSWQYNIGIGDVLSITVWDHPELTLPAGPERSQLESGSTVNENGDIFYPYLGQVHVAGRLVGDVQRTLTQRLREYIPDPQIEVKVAAFNAQKVVITGAVTTAQSLPITNIPLTLLEAVNAAGGITENANSRHVSIRRNGVQNHVNLQAFLESGQAGSNPILRGGDIVNIPISELEQAYILGKISKPGIVTIGEDGLNLTEALTRQGGLDEARADASGIFVFRNHSDGIDVFQLDATTPLAFVLATKFALKNDDVVYIVADPAARWNEIIGQLIPTIGAIRQTQLIGEDL